MSDRVLELIDKLSLSPHPEGGYYKEIYRSKEFISKENLPERYKSDHTIATSIYYLLTTETNSNFHRIKQDEIWYFHEGDSIKLHVLKRDGSYEMALLGPNVLMGEYFQYTVPGGSWFAAETEGKYSLVGCGVAPGFEFEDFELAKRNRLNQKYPDQKEIIEKFTNP